MGISHSILQQVNDIARDYNDAALARSSPDRVPDRVAASAVQELSFPAYEPTYESAPTTDPASGPNSSPSPEAPPSQLQPVHLEHVPAVDCSSLPPPPNGLVNLGVQGIPGGRATTTSHCTPITHCTERSQDFASTSRNSRRLDFAKEDPRIQRLQLACSDGSEREDLDVDARNSTEPKSTAGLPSKDTSARLDSEPTAPPNNAIVGNCKVAIPTSSNTDRLAISASQIDPFPEHKPPCRSGLTIDPSPLSNINGPPQAPPLQFQTVDRSCSGHGDNISGAGARVRPLPRPNGQLSVGGACKPVSGHSSHGATTNIALQPQSLASQSGTFSGTGAAHHTQATCLDPKAPRIASAADSELRNAGSELIFRLTRRGKTGLHGVRPQHLRMSDLSAYFHLTAVDAAKKLGVSLTTMKKACRKFGLRRWPGRKVRSLESTIHEVEHTIAVGHGACLEESNEVSKLQQEMDQLVHGTPAQVTSAMQSPAVRTADIYKHLHSRARRSKSHRACHEDTLNNGNPAQQALPTTSKYRKAVRGNQGRKGPRKLAVSKEDSAVVPPEQPTSNTGKEHSRAGFRDTVMMECDIEGLLPDVHDMPNGAAEPALMADNGTTKCRARTSVGVGTEEAITTGERSPKRPKRQ